MRTKSIVTILAGLVLLFASSSSAAEMRKWTHKDGNEFEAEFVKVEKDSKEHNIVTLRKPDGTLLTVGMGGLSDEDRKYVRQILKSPGKEEPKGGAAQKPAEQAAPRPNAEMRKWSHKNGKEFEAEFVKRDGAEVTLRGKDGKEFTVKMGGLSSEDRKYVNQLTKGKKEPTEPKESDDQKPAEATWRMAGEYPSVAGKWIESEEGKRYVTITQDGNNFVGKSNVFGDKQQYRVEGTISKGGRMSGKITSSKDGHDDNPGPMTGQVDNDGKMVRLHSKEGGSWSDWTLTKEPGKHKKEKPEVAANDNKPSPSQEEPIADQPKTMIVEAKGSGKDRDEALKDAFREAVRKVVGAFVEEETVVKNDQIIKDQVLTYSGGWVRTHGIVSEDSNGGAVHLTIWALVEQDKVVKRLKAASVSVKEVAGGKIWDEIQTKRWKDKEAEELLRSVLKGFPESCMRVEVVGEPKPVNPGECDPSILTAEQREDVAKGRVPHLTEEQATRQRQLNHENRGNIRVTVQLSVDQTAFEAFRERLLTVLDHISNDSKDFLIQFSERPNTKGLFYQVQSSFPQTEWGDATILLVNTSRNELWTRLGWRIYRLDKKLEPILAEAAGRACECVLSVSDKSGKSQPIAMFNPRYEQGNPSPIRFLNTMAFFLSSTFVSNHPYNLRHQPKVFYLQLIDMTENEVKNLQKIKCELRFSEGKGDN